MLLKSQAIVLNKTKYDDTSEIVSLFTEAAGIVTFIVRIPKTRRASIKNFVLQLLNLLEIEWDHREGSGLRRLRNLRCSHPYASLPYHSVKASMSQFLGEFLFYALRNEHEGAQLFPYLVSSLIWFDEADRGYTNFHLVLMLHLSRFLGILPQALKGERHLCFDLLNACYADVLPVHSYYVTGREATFLPKLLRMNFHNMHLFAFSRQQRTRLLALMNDYYRLHIPNFPQLKSIEILREVFNA